MGNFECLDSYNPPFTLIFCFMWLMKLMVLGIRRPNTYKIYFLVEF